MQIQNILCLHNSCSSFSFLCSSALQAFFFHPRTFSRLVFALHKITRYFSFHFQQKVKRRDSPPKASLRPISHKLKQKEGFEDRAFAAAHRLLLRRRLPTGTSRCPRSDRNQLSPVAHCLPHTPERLSHQPSPRPSRRAS